MKLLVTGAGGQLATELVRRAGVHQVIALAQTELDITDAAAVFRAVENIAPDAVVNAAAYTAVDRAESEVEIAFAANRDGPAHLAAVCVARGIPLLHVSTDYVFDGTKAGAYTEQDPPGPGPLGVYGQSKAKGEAAVRAVLPEHIILRPSWIFSAHGNNFVKTMLKLAGERDELRVVADQHGCPTAAGDLAAAILVMLAHAVEHDGCWGTYHFCQPEATTWHGFAEAIIDEARIIDQAAGTQSRALVRVQNIVPITTAEYPTPARRPANSVLDCAKLTSVFGIHPRPWRASLHQVIQELV